MTLARNSYFDYWAETIAFPAASAKLLGGGEAPVNILSLVSIEGWGEKMRENEKER